MAVNDRQKYNYMENELQQINRNFIALPDEEVRQNNEFLEEILQIFITEMANKDKLFKKMYSRLFYGGSFYDGLRVGHPEEFDLDLLFVLPKYAEPVLPISNIPGFMHLQFKALDKFLKQPEAKEYVGLLKLLDSKQQYLITTQVLAWMESVANKALNSFTDSNNSAIIKTTYGLFQCNLKNSGPALTLKLKGTIGAKKVMIDIDLVPCFVFTKEHWPSSYRPYNESYKKEFFIVPKLPKSSLNISHIIGRYWRLSFQEQERFLIKDLRTLKPTCKLLKKLRDNECPIIASYFIKTIFLLEIESNRRLFTDYSLSYVFMFMLKKYQQYIAEGNIPYYWNKSNNLLANIKPIALRNHANRLARIIADIEKHPGDATVIREYLGCNISTKQQLQSRQLFLQVGESTAEAVPPEEIVPPRNENGSNCTLL